VWSVASTGAISGTLRDDQPVVVALLTEVFPLPAIPKNLFQDAHQIRAAVFKTLAVLPHPVPNSKGFFAERVQIAVFFPSDRAEFRHGFAEFLM